ncbi:MAG TPA: metalloregulator ArsR/SmtB family transcription factor [Phycisphaerales bacterium]|nr:metalloregulator ArsR/SmtB family transcription factor [Phycisphaerales bacterium]
MNKAASTSLVDRLTALSEPVRLRLLRLLEKEELSVGELARIVQLPQSTVSRHLKVLTDGGWIVSRSEGTSTLLRLVRDDLEQAHRDLWHTVREQMGAGAELEEDNRRLTGVLNERRGDTQAFFGRVAGQWDGVRQELFGDRATVQSLLALLPAHWTVADIGCGTGNAAEVLAPLVAKVIAIDQSDAMLAAARKRLKGIDNVEFLRGDVEKLPLKDASVDAAVCVLVLHHIEDPAVACAEMARILKPGGTCLVVDMVEHDRVQYKHAMGHRWLGFGIPELVRLLGAAGLSDVRFSVLPAAADAKGPGLFACTARKSAPLPRKRPA